jgi:ABC-type transport system involved in multi-copper enzyme maturation permease subunit
MTATTRPGPGARAGLGAMRLWRYNYRILIGNGYWIIVLPIAASQMVTLWMMALAKDFGQMPATFIAEMMAPILAAFLVAHSMAPEYKSSVGAVLACKPLSLHRVVTMRVVIAMLASLALT